MIYLQSGLFGKAKPRQEPWLDSCQQIHEKLQRTLPRITIFNSIPGRLIIHLW